MGPPQQKGGMGMTRIEELRKMRKNKTRADLSRTYDIPIRTLEDWEAGKANPPEYVIDLLERAIREDEQLPRIYRVYVMHGADESEDMKTANRKEAIRWAQRITKYHDKKDIEIRIYSEDIDDEECECFDYDTIDF